MATSKWAQEGEAWANEANHLRKRGGLLMCHEVAQRNTNPFDLSTTEICHYSHANASYPLMAACDTHDIDAVKRILLDESSAFYLPLDSGGGRLELLRDVVAMDSYNADCIATLLLQHDFKQMRASEFQATVHASLSLVAQVRPPQGSYVAALLSHTTPGMMRRTAASPSSIARTREMLALYALLPLDASLDSGGKVRVYGDLEPPERNEEYYVIPRRIDKERGAIAPGPDPRVLLYSGEAESTLEVAFERYRAHDLARTRGREHAEFMSNLTSMPGDGDYGVPCEDDYTEYADGGTRATKESDSSSSDSDSD